MKLNATLDVDVLAHESDDEVTVLLDLQAPARGREVERPAATVQIVLDRSGSMDGAPLAGAKSALSALVQRLDPADQLGVVTFDDEAQVVVPTAPLTDKAAALTAIAGIQPGGCTDLGAGYLRALRELRRTGDKATYGATLLVVSDGHVNSGMRDLDQFGSIATKAYRDGVVTTTLGYGHGYDETLLSQIARSGNGNHVFAADPDAAGAAICGEVEGLLEKVAQAVSLIVHCEPAVEMLRLYNDLPAKQIGQGQVMVELGDLYSEETRKLLLKLQVPAIAALGVARIATLHLQYVELPGLVEQSLRLPIQVNVVPGDEATGRVPDPVVGSELLFMEAQDAKRTASEAFQRGDVATGRSMLGVAKTAVASASAIAPPAAAADLQAEAAELARMEALTEVQEATYLSKLTHASYHQQNRKRGRRQPGEA